MGIRLRTNLLLLTITLLSCIAYSQPNESFSFLVAGHAYGSHSGTNTGLHPEFISSLNKGFDTSARFIVFTGDIVRTSNSESWKQVEDELTEYQLPYYYVMGNHDDNEVGKQVFNDKFGATYYSFNYENQLFIILNSTETNRSISEDQLGFLDLELQNAGDSIRNVFIFFHEVLWNSNEKYIGVKSNSRSRYTQIISYSNYWEEVHPILTVHSDRHFYIISGDVAGNPDAIAAFYDSWDNVVLLSSGMGEVADENYLKITVNEENAVDYKLVPLNSEIYLDDIELYSVPQATDSILGPGIIQPGSNSIEYNCSEIQNSTSYSWLIPPNTAGTSTSSMIYLDFNSDFEGGNLSVSAYKEGFGYGPETTLPISALGTHAELQDSESGILQLKIKNFNSSILLNINHAHENSLLLTISSGTGKILLRKRVEVLNESAEIVLSKNNLPKGLLLVSIHSKTCKTTRLLFNQ